MRKHTMPFFVILLWVFCGSASAQNAFLEKQITLTSSVTTARDAIREVSRLANSDSLPGDLTLFVFESNEDAFKLVPSLPSTVESQGMDNTLYLERQSLPVAQTELNGSTTTVGEMLARIESDFGVHPLVKNNGLITITDPEHIGASYWPLNTPVDVMDSSKTMTYLEVLRLLDSKYHLDLPPVFDFSDPNVEFMCDCNDQVAWQGTNNLVQVRDLVVSILKTANACTRSKDPNAPAWSYQIKAGPQADSEIWYFTVISF